ncbi:hypothetical protein [Dolichospermum circinale]|nr:hypothetical protein [Dolichospermum circinale]MDB9484350.1 hypothetical protein [Dolichospermum circinale CS-537/05]
MATLQDTTAIILVRSHQFLKPTIAPYIPKQRSPSVKFSNAL